MAKPEWGAKRICLSCGARFYDLQRDPIICPSCETAFDPAVPSKPRRAKPPPKAAAVAAVAVVKPEAEVEEEAEAEEEAEVEVEVEVEEEAEAGEKKVKVAADDTDDDDDEEEGESAIEDVSELGDDDVTDVIDTDLENDESDR